MTEIHPNEVYTTTETQDLLKISKSTMKRMIKAGLIKGAKIGNQYRFLGHELLSMLSPKIDEEATRTYQKIKKVTKKKMNEW